MKRVKVIIEREPGTSEIPAPFFADGKPCWTALLNPEQLAGIRKIIAKPSLKFLNQIKKVTIDGEVVFGG